MLDLIKAVYRKQKDKIIYEARQYEFANKQLDSAFEAIKEGWEKGETYDSNWITVASTKDEGMVFDEENQGTMRTQAYKFWKSNPIARGIIRTFVKFVFGKGAEFHPIAKKDKKIQDIWDDFERRNKFKIKQKEIGKRCFRDGEAFIWYSANDEGDTTIRFIDPDCIKDPEGDISHGIETDKNDVEIIKNYLYSPDGTEVKRIPAEEIQHIKILVDSNVKRGLSLLYVVMKYLLHYDKWLHYRLILNFVRTSVTLVRNIEGGTPAQIASIGAASESPNASSSSKQKMHKPGTVLTAGGGVSYDLLAPNMQAQDAAHDGREIKLGIAAGLSIAEFMVTADASNANYASTMVSESPAVREFESWQEFFAIEFEEIFRRVIQAKIDAGKLTGGKDTLLADIQFPEMVHRKIKEETEAYEMHRNMTIASRTTIAARLGYDFPTEQEKIEQEEEKYGDNFPVEPKPEIPPEKPDKKDEVDTEEEKVRILSSLKQILQDDKSKK